MISDVQINAKGDLVEREVVDGCRQVNLARIEDEVPLVQTAARKPENFRLAYWPMVCSSSQSPDKPLFHYLQDLSQRKKGR